MKALAIAGTNLRRVFRDRTAAFFILLFPFLIILALGSLYGTGFAPALGVVSEGSGPLGTDLVGRLERTDGLRVRAFDRPDALAGGVRRGHVEAGLVIPVGYDERVRDGDTVELVFLSRPGGAGEQTSLAVAAVVDEQGVVVRAARLAVEEGMGFDAALDAARTAAGSVPRVQVRTSTTGGLEVAGTFDYGAAQMLVLFVFQISLAAASMLVESRRLGVSLRMLSTPTPARTILGGELLGRLGIALFQGLLIVGVTALVFRVDWGDLRATAVIVVAFASVGAAAAMLSGSAFRSEQVAGSFGVFLGLVLAALGGSMVPLEVFPETIRTLAHVTPHAWAIDAFGDVLAGGGVGDILAQLGVLLGYAAVLLVLAITLFRRRLTA